MSSFISMSNSRGRNPGEPSSTPTRNFSHPNRQRASSLSPEHNQDNPLITINDSRYMLPVIPSRFFSRSTSTQSLQTERDHYADFDFDYESPPRPETSHIAFSLRSVPDLDATALPPMPNREAPPIPPISQQYAAPASSPPAVTIKPPSPSRSIRRPHPSPTKSAKSGKGSRWGRWSMRVKTVFMFRRHRKSPALPAVIDFNEPSGPEVNIGRPSSFQHHVTHGKQGLRAADGMFVPPASEDPVLGDAGGTSAMISSGGLGISGLGQPPSSCHDAETGASDAGPSRENRYAGLGHQDADGTALSDDGDSAWEEDEGSRIYLEYQKRKGRFSFNPR